MKYTHFTNFQRYRVSGYFILLGKNVQCSKGFTLIELLIVLVIIGLSSSLLIANTSKVHKATTPEVIVFLEGEQKGVLKTQKATSILLTATHLLSTASGAIFKIPEQVLDTQKKTYLPHRALVSFYPDGTMSSAKLTLTTKTATYVIETSPFSNKIAYKVQ